MDRSPAWDRTPDASNEASVVADSDVSQEISTVIHWEFLGLGASETVQRSDLVSFLCRDLVIVVDHGGMTHTDYIDKFKSIFLILVSSWR